MGQPALKLARGYELGGSQGFVQVFCWGEILMLMLLRFVVMLILLCQV